MKIEVGQVWTGGAMGTVDELLMVSGDPYLSRGLECVRVGHAERSGSTFKMTGTPVEIPVTELVRGTMIFDTEA